MIFLKYVAVAVVVLAATVAAALLTKNDDFIPTGSE